MQQTKQIRNYFLLAVLLLAFPGFALAQIDTTTTIKPDSTAATPKPDSAAAKKSEEKPKKEKKDTYILYAGVNFNTLSVSSDAYESTSEVGWQLGAMYKSKGTIYWGVGARYNSAAYKFNVLNAPDSNSFTVTDVDIPITAGINLLPFVNRVVNIHLFVSAVPAFEIDVNDNSLGIKKEDTNTFIMYGQAGFGVDVLFLVLDVGYNYGFSDLLKEHKSMPGQVFVNLGFRF